MSVMSKSGFVTRPEPWLQRLPLPDGSRSLVVFEHESLTAKIYAPVGEDLQQPHRRDEVYVVGRGTATFVHGEERSTATEGSILFAPAAMPHRFEELSDDFFVWVFFYGPDDGENGEWRGAVMDAAEFESQLPRPDGARFIEVFTHGTLSLELYEPRGVDPQQPHLRDELYVVIRGSGQFRHGEAVDAVSPGSFLFVQARMEHRFEEFSNDFAVWVMFYGPQPA